MPSTAGTMNGVVSDPKKAGKSKKGAPVEEKPPEYDANLPEPKTRADLMKHWWPVSLDDRTAQKLLWISEGGMKVSRMTDETMCPYLDRPERYEHSPQVLCKEGINGWRGYWEVEFDGWVVVGIMLESSARKTKDGPCGLGENETSWGVGWAGNGYHVWHNAENVIVDEGMCNTLGIYLDQPAGIIKFYMVQTGADGAKEVKQLHQFKAKFTEKVFPGFWVGRQSFCWICKKD
ncbi:stonustoxin subunit beta isoform X2 [Engraulis encrasicolus]|uniref:stonustoxin subunit beta isoform X2 n=1 Tax=Engraulis encrasicolus TaxID=184585 RepID=UPI002FD43BC5